MPLHYWKWAPKSIWRCRIRWWHLFVTKIAYSPLKIDFPLGAVSVPPLKVWSVKYTLVTWPNLKGCRSTSFVERCYRSIYQVNTSYRCWDLEGWFGPNFDGLARGNWPPGEWYHFGILLLCKVVPIRTIQFRPGSWECFGIHLFWYVPV